jgi:CspA family cold shock protein
MPERLPSDILRRSAEAQALKWTARRAHFAERDRPGPHATQRRRVESSLTGKKRMSRIHASYRDAEGSMTLGTVKWFNDAKGFGFIQPEEGGEDVFAHFSAIQMDGFRTLKQGGRVSFELVQGPKGQLAQNISPVDVAPPTLSGEPTALQAAPAKN